MQTLNFFETSSAPFNINLEELEREIDSLTDALEQNLQVNLIFNLGYKQTNTVSTSSSSSSSGSKSLEKSFRISVRLNKQQISNLLLIYSTIRNIGSLDNPDRSLKDLASIKLEFDTNIVVYHYAS